MHYKGGGFNCRKESRDVVMLVCIKRCAMGFRFNARPQILRKLVCVIFVLVTHEHPRESFRIDDSIPGTQCGSALTVAGSQVFKSGIGHAWRVDATEWEASDRAVPDRPVLSRRRRPALADPAVRTRHTGQGKPV